MKKELSAVIYEAPSLEIVDIITEGNILTGSGIAGGDAGGEDGWDD